jgi:hypothetical protein
MIKRLTGVFLLRSNVFLNIGTDPSATWQAAIIVTIVAILASISAAISATIWKVGYTAANVGLGLVDDTIADIGFRLPVLDGPIAAFLSKFVGVFVSWLLWAFVTWLIGEYIFKGDTGFAEMARIIGYAKAPQILSGLGFIPGVGWLARLAGFVWMIIATFIGIKAGLELDTGKTILTIVVSAIVVFLVDWFVVNPIIANLF